MRTVFSPRWFPRSAPAISILLATSLHGTIVAQATTASPTGGRQLFALDVASGPAGGIPTGIRLLRGKLTAVTKDGASMLKASEPAEFLINLSEPLPDAFNIEFDLIPKACCNPEDLSFEGTAAISRSAASMHVVWHPETMIAVGGGEYVQHPMPEDIKETLPSQPAKVQASFQGTAFKLYTNGRLVDLPNRRFVRGRVLRVFLGGQDDDQHAVYLSKLRIAEGPATVAATSTTVGVLTQSSVTVPGTAPAPVAVAPTTTSVTAPSSTGAAAGPVTAGANTTSSAVATATQATDPTSMLVGTGISDITGPIAEVGMMGYGKFSQQTAGLHTRLYAHAYAADTNLPGHSVLLVDDGHRVDRAGGRGARDVSYSRRRQLEERRDRAARALRGKHEHFYHPITRIIELV